MEESISKVRENSNSCLRLPILHPWKRIAVLRCVSVFDSILWTRCLLQRLNVSSGFSVFKVILAFSGFNRFLRLLFICFFRYNGKQFLFPCSSFQKKLQGDMRARYDISSILQCFFFFLVPLCSLNCMNPTRVLLFYPHRPLFLSIDKDILFESQRNLTKKGLIEEGPLFLRLSTKISHDCYVAQNISLVFSYKYVHSET